MWGSGVGHKPVGILVKETYLEERPEELVLGALRHIHITVTKEPSFQENMPPNLSESQTPTLGSRFSPCTMKVPGIKLRSFGMAASDSTYQTISQAPAVVLCGGYRLPHIHWHHHEGGIGLAIMTQVGPQGLPPTETGRATIRPLRYLQHHNQTHWGHPLFRPFISVCEKDFDVQRETPQLLGWGGRRDPLQVSQPCEGGPPRRSPAARSSMHTGMDAKMCQIPVQGSVEKAAGKGVGSRVPAGADAFRFTRNIHQVSKRFEMEERCGEMA